MVAHNEPIQNCNFFNGSKCHEIFKDYIVISFVVQLELIQIIVRIGGICWWDISPMGV